MKNNIRTMRYIFLIFLVGILTVKNAEASQGDLLKEFDLQAVIDLQNNALLDPIPLPFPTQDFAVDYQGRIYAAPSSSNNRTIVI